MAKKEYKTSGKAGIQVFELTMDNPENQDDLNRLLHKPGENSGPPEMLEQELNDQSAYEGAEKKNQMQRVPFQVSLLDQIREDLYATLGQASLACLRVYLGGYLMGGARAGKAVEVDPRMGRFSEWLTEKIAGNQLSISGFEWLRMESEDEARALERFFEMWDEYTSNIEPLPGYSEHFPIPAPTTFRDLLSSIRKRPGMYLGSPSITLLRAFIQGYTAAVSSNPALLSEMPDFEDFSVWLARHETLRKTYRWDRLLLLSTSDEKDAMERFFILFADYETCRAASH